jgi:peptidoglycan-associated lipoprotein
MNPRRFVSIVSGLSILLLAGCVLPAYSSNNQGKLRLTVHPAQAYTFVDGAALKEQGCKLSHLCTIWLSPGDHTVSVHNYGYKTFTQKVTLEAGKVTNLDVTLQPEGGPVSPPWGRIMIKGAPSHAAVLLNGTKPAYFVGNVDEFDHEFLTGKEELVVPPGTQHVTITWWGNEIWSGDVTVHANETTTIYVKRNGATETKPWPEGQKLTSLPRFKAGFASATVAVAPVKGQISASQTSIKCGESSQLNWSSSEAVDTEISGMGEVAASGNQSVSPKETTTYDFTASGPGGIVKSSATVDVDKSIQASLNMEPSEVRYHKVGDKVIEQGSATLTWSTSNAQSVSIEPLGNVDANGSRTITPTPKQTQPGPVDETETYTLNATNSCGGSVTKTATLHITGLIEAAHHEVALSSVFFPTDWPDHRHPQDGLLDSQKDALNKLAQTFTAYHNDNANASLRLESHADRRGPRHYNQLLSERRAEIVKAYLVSQGVPADAIQIQAFGETQNLSLEEVKRLESENTEKVTIRHWISDRMAHNRRVDVVLLPDNKRSTPYYPHNATDVHVLSERPKPSLRTIRKYQK